MLRVQLICTGKLKESFYAAACEEYNKRLQRYCSPEIIELPETGDIKRDGAAMLARIGSGAFIVAMCIEGKGCSSEELASLMAQCAVQGKSRVCFLIGGSDGLSDEVKRAADVRLSMSRMTFPHHWRGSWFWSRFTAPSTSTRAGNIINKNRRGDPRGDIMEETGKASAEWGRQLPGDLYERWPKDEAGQPEPPVYLCHCKGIDMDETMLVTRLEAFGIPCLRQYPNDGQFGKLILGISGSGVDIFVPASVWEDACELIRESDDETEEEQ